MSSEYSHPAAALPEGPMPLLGFGTWQISDSDVEEAVTVALESGYRHIDTATMYRNEAGIGRALAATPVPRDEIFVTTKLPPDRADDARGTLEQSLSKLGLDHVDLWLIHWPASDNVALWKEFVQAREDGLTRSIGVSNFTLEGIDELTDATGTVPAVNQVRWAPALYDAEFVAGMHERGVVLEGYSPFKLSDLQDPTLVTVAEAHGISTAQVIVAWHAAHGFVVIPKSARRERIESNAAGIAVGLTPDEVAAIDGLAG
jgi:2,5-diketo-D-gluconate reductase A